MFIILKFAQLNDFIFFFTTHSVSQLENETFLCDLKT